MIDPSTALAFSVFENRGVFALLIGSGVSRTAQIPTGWEVVLDLTRRVAALEGVQDQIDWAAWHQERFGEPPNYSKLLDALAQTAEERRSILHTVIEPTAEDIEEGRKTPTKAHKAIARLVRNGFIRVIITTNFDRLLENALRAEGVEPTVIKSDDDLQGAVPLVHTRCFVLKVHGDYLDTRLRNTEGELESYSPALNTVLDRILDEHGLVVCGWSADWDTALRAALTRVPNRRFPTFWASRGKPSPLAEDLLAQRAGRMIPISDADSFFEELERKVEIQSELQRPNPRSVEILVASIKKYLPRPEHRIQLADLVRNEVGNVRKQISDAGIGADAPWTPDEFRRRTARYEAIVEPLARLFLTMGRWGDDQELGLVTDVLRGFAELPFQGGIVAWSTLRTYPAVLLLYAYGIGATKSGRYSALRRWLGTPLRSDRDETRKSAVERLFLWAWPGGEDNLWKNLMGLEQRKTALSDHLADVLVPIAERELLSAEDVALAFETFEVLASLAHLSSSTDKASIQAALQTQGQQNFVWVPVGRTGWHREARAAIMAEISEPETRQALLAAGFAGGDEEFMALCLDNIGRIMGRLSWF
jgi:hypothetical protein